MPEFWKEHPARFCVFHFTLEAFMHILCVSQNGPNSLFMRYFPQYSCFGSMTQKLSVQLCFPHFAIVLSQYGVRAIAESHSYCPKVSHVHKKSSIPLRFHLSSLSSDMFLLSFCDVCCMWEIICLRQRFHKFQHLFFLMFWLLDKHSRRSNPFFFITKSEVWVVFMVCFFFKGRFWDISSILSDLFFCVFVCVCFWICFPEYLWFDVYNFVVPHHVPTKWPATFKRLRSWVVVDAYLCSSCCKTIWNTTVFMFSSFLPSCPAKWRDKSSSKRLQDGSALAFCHFLERIQW